MDQSKINVRYAKAFFSLAKEKGLTAELRQDAKLIAGVCEQSSDFSALLNSPVVKTSGKQKALRSIFEGKVNSLSLNFLLLITENRREKFIAGIFRNLEELYRREEGVKTAILTSAVPISDDIVLQVKKILENEYQSKVELSQKINPDIIGGFVLRIGDQQYDASIWSQLKKFKEQLHQTELK